MASTPDAKGCSTPTSAFASPAALIKHPRQARHMMKWVPFSSPRTTFAGPPPARPLHSERFLSLSSVCPCGAKKRGWASGHHLLWAEQTPGSFGGNGANRA